MPLTSLAKPENQSRAARCLKCLECCRCLNRITLQCPPTFHGGITGPYLEGGCGGSKFQSISGKRACRSCRFEGDSSLEPAGLCRFGGTPPSLFWNLGCQRPLLQSCRVRPSCPHRCRMSRADGQSLWRPEICASHVTTLQNAIFISILVLNSALCT